ncbi:MAG: glycoside hydrolase family 15 protein [Planctomycetota bacterium]|nr:glycoside hydrolase family 15 protein [Planctomycetota bacterium]
MARDIPIGNGDLLVTFDHSYRVRDVYYPFVGRYNHTDGREQRFGAWVDGRLAWVEEPGWRRELRYRPDSLVTDVVLTHDELGVQLLCADCVDFHEPVYFRHVVVRDLQNRPRDVRLFFHWDLSIRGHPVGDTANYDPASSSIVMYKDDIYFLFNARNEFKSGIDHWAIGAKRLRGAEGTWRDAEDGHLGRNAISQGSVDCTIGCNLRVPAGGEASVTSWLVAGRSYDEVKRTNNRVQNAGPTRMISRTESYWRLWAKKEPLDTSTLPTGVRDLFYRSQLLIRTQIDNRGAIIAANDSDITQFGGDHYSYCWPRDGALVAHALVLSAQSELSRNYFRFCARAIEEDGYFLHKYTPTGELASSWHPWIIEGQRVLPIQQDQTSLVMWALREHYNAFRDVEFVKGLYQPLVVNPAEWTLRYVDGNGLPQQSWDLWEERRGVHTFTVATTIGALEAAAAFAEDFGDLDRATRFRAGAQRMREAFIRHMWHEGEQRFARMAIPVNGNGYKLDMTPDSANYAIWAFRALDAHDPRVVADMAALRELLLVRTDVGGQARYKHDYYHQIEREQVDRVPGNPWVICTLWHAQYDIARARTLAELERATELMEWAVKRAEASGVLAEQFHPYTGAAMSVSPLTWSHATFVIVVIEYLRKRRLLLALELESRYARQGAVRALGTLPSMMR